MVYHQPYAGLLCLLLLCQFTLNSSIVYSQGDLSGSVVVAPTPLARLNPEFIYRGAVTTHPLHFPDLHGIHPGGEAEFLNRVYDWRGVRRVIDHLANDRRSFILTDGFLATNNHIGTTAFDYELLDLRHLDCIDCWEPNLLWTVEDRDYWLSIKRLYEKGYRPVLNHHFKDLSPKAMVMQHLSAPLPGTGSPAIYIDGTPVRNSSVARGAVQQTTESLISPIVSRSVTELVPDYQTFLSQTSDRGRTPPSGSLDSPSMLVEDAGSGGRSEVNYRTHDSRAVADSSSIWLYHDEGRVSLNSVADMPVFVDSSADLDTVDDWGGFDGRNSPAELDSEFIVVTHNPEAPGNVTVKRLPVADRLKLLKPEVRLRYQQVCTVLRRQHWRSRLRSGAAGGGRLLRGVGAGLAVQYGASEGLKATTGMDDDTANMVVMPFSEAVGMVAVDLALPTVATTTSTAAAGTTAATTTAATTTTATTAVAGAVGGLAVITEATRRSADQHSLKLAYDDSSMEMGTSMTINLMRRNAQLRDIGEISQEELIRRNKALGDSARREGERTVKEAQWIGERYSNGFTACFGTIGDGWDYWTGRSSSD